MPQIIETNILSLTAQRNLNGSQSLLATSIERLSSGLRINSAKDDAAGLAISERMTAQIRGLNQASRNANDGISFAQTAEGALGTVGDALQRIRELAVQSINDTNSSSDRQALNNEVSQLIAEVNRIATSTQFNGGNILDGTLSTLTFQVGANQNQTIQVDGVDVRTTQLGAASDEGDSIDTTTPVAAGTFADVSLNGLVIDLSTAESLSDVANLINENSSLTNVEAIRSSTTSTATDLTYTADTDAQTISINGVNVNIIASATLADVVTSINNVSTQSGVTASDVGGALHLENSDGSDIVLLDGVSAGDGTNDADILGSDVTFSAGFILATDVGETITVAGTDAAALGLSAIAVTDSTLSGVNVLTGDNATDALLTIDFALQQVNGLRAELGAVQSRFESTISNLAITAEDQ